MRHRVARLCGLSALLVVPLVAQNNARLTGLVLDPAGAAVPSAEVKLSLAGSAQVVYRTITNERGAFFVAGLLPQSYDMTVEARGFALYRLTGIKVDPSQERSVPPISLELASVTAEVAVSADSETVQTGNTEISTTITREQVRYLPIVARRAMSLVATQAGTARAGSVINGARVSYTNITLDGINIQDQFLMISDISALQGTLFLDQIAEATITVSNSSAAAGFGASQVQFVTPTGTNEWHGSAYWYNRDRLLSSNFWQGNQFGSQRPPLHQNQGGVTIGLPLRRDRLFVYGNWESVRVREAIPVNRTILTSDARAGIFTYEDQDGNIRKPNLLQLAGVTMDPAIRSVLERVPGPDRINNFQIGDSRESVLKNTAGYLFNGGVWSDTDTALGRVDLLLSQSNSISGSYLWNRGSGGRPHNSAGYSVEPIAGARTRYKVSTLAWRWSAGPRFTNELRGGVNVSSAGSKNPDFQGRYLLQGTVFSNPALPGANNWRDTDTFTLSDGATYVRGVHTLRIGAETRIVRSRLTNDFGTIPTYTLGIGLGNPGLTVEQLPGARTPDVSLANNLLATLAGYVTSYSQSFNVTDRLSGFVPGAPNLRRLRLGSHAAYVTHQWKAMRGLTLNLGLRYEYHSPMDETNGLVLLPKVQAAGAAATLLSNATLDFAGGSTGRSLYAPDGNNFSPHAGVAYDLFGNGRTALRAAYGVHYVNDESIFAVFLTGNEGLEAFSARQGLSARLTAGLPAIPAPVFRIPRTAEDNYRGNQGAALAMPDPALRTPYVQQWTLGIQHQVAGNVIEARYIGNHVSKA